MARAADLPDVDSRVSQATLTKVPVVSAWFSSWAFGSPTC
jgi:hypothetical protein